MKGTLYLIPVPLADDAAIKSFTAYCSEVIKGLRLYIVENEKTARKFLKLAYAEVNLPEVEMLNYGKHAKGTSLGKYFKALEAGQDVGMMSEAGCPAVADPGAAIVAEAHRRSIRVVPLVGPNSMILALMSSGFNGQQFTFKGYLPIDKAEREKAIKQMEVSALRHGQTQIFMETPFRNNVLLDVLLKVLPKDVMLCIAVDLTAATEMVATKRVEEWQKDKPDLHKRPCLFLLGRS